MGSPLQAAQSDTRIPAGSLWFWQLLRGGFINIHKTCCKWSATLFCQHGSQGVQKGSVCGKKIIAGTSACHWRSAEFATGFNHFADPGKDTSGPPSLLNSVCYERRGICCSTHLKITPSAFVGQNQGLKKTAPEMMWP